MLNIAHRVCLVITVLLNYKCNSIEVNRKYVEDPFIQDAHIIDILKPIEHEFQSKENSAEYNQIKHDLEYTANTLYGNKYKEDSKYSRILKKEDENILIKKQRVVRQIKSGNSQLYPQLYPSPWNNTPLGQNGTYYPNQNTVVRPNTTIIYSRYTTPGYVFDNRTYRPQYPSYSQTPKNYNYNIFNTSSQRPGSVPYYNYTSHGQYPSHGNAYPGQPTRPQISPTFNNSHPSYPSYVQNTRPPYNATLNQYPTLRPDTGMHPYKNNTRNYNYPTFNSTNQRPPYDGYRPPSNSYGYSQPQGPPPSNSYGYSQTQGPPPSNSHGYPQTSFNSNGYNFNPTFNQHAPYNSRNPNAPNPDQNFYYVNNRNATTYDPRKNPPNNFSYGHGY
ncbi:uncharacterized protein ACR2FA_006928 [Aphomia sociella]